MISIDRREKRDTGGGVELATEVRACGFQAEVVELKFGDVRFTGNGPSGPWAIGMELKKVTDLVGSVHTSRLSDHQIPGMHELYDRCYVVVQGRTKRNWETGALQTLKKRGGEWTWVDLHLGPATVPWSALDSMIASIRHQGGCYVERTGNLTETAEFIVSEYTWWQKRWGDHSTFRGFMTGAPTPLVVRRPGFPRRVAKELPNIGWEKSTDVVQRFKSVEGMVKAAVEEWMSIPGIGRTIAERAYRALRERG